MLATLRPMNFSHDELIHELTRTEATMDTAARRAGEGADPELERQLDAHARALRVMLGADGADVVADAVDAAKRVLHSAEPAAPLLMLQMARDNLSSIVRRSQRLGQAA
ncbi:hypothetical protein [Novilysobacter spongiicola]|uniref:Uncharacterized protein n=1 Tax=Lysobacter spongiicola DSM 21749 TaxID=1122188 RepID=A0A1T4Q1T5_9GAMM|nr:hypothetical protein [Lysobacter spongiicola]SJZ97733.1 hypothetical protein SAMN02745674_01443 [Lysobacter spongiicola DSM 21749]